jgi:hypothetical protein
LLGSRLASTAVRALLAGQRHKMAGLEAAGRAAADIEGALLL